ncbi:unnamed protein product [Spodoptera exigua]|nr:unnamed protein product [Spodoptera exigua]
MSETSRKRCRKSKLVPRECVLLEEEDLEQQIPLQKIFIPVPVNKSKTITQKDQSDECDKSVLKKINAAVRKSLEEQELCKDIKEPQRKFEVAIKIETCDEEMNPELNLEDNKTIIRRHLSDLDVVPLPTIELKAEDILKAVDNIINSSSNIADKALCLYVRNTIGQYVRKVSTPSLHEVMVQEALDQWQPWYHHSRYVNRTPPISYKCYICRKSWWHLSEFKEHITEHKNLNIDFERINNYESVLIASSDIVLNIADIFTEGFCSLCGKDYDHHKLCRDVNGKFQGNSVCGKKLNNCYSLMLHTANCEICSIGLNFKCEVCSVKFNEKIHLDEHLVLCHTVRSDVPIGTGFKTCQCSEQYVSKYHHICIDKSPNFQCSNCKQSFYYKQQMDSHMFSQDKEYTCEICNEACYRPCIKYKHLMKHTDQFMMVSKCSNCPGLNIFVDEEDELYHKRMKHGHDLQGMKKQHYFPKLLVPVSCIIHSLKYRADIMPTLNIKEEIQDSHDYSSDDYQAEVTDIKMENDFVEDEPEDSEGPEDEGLVIKEEPIRSRDTSMIDYENSDEEEDPDEDYNGDIIKINGNHENVEEFSNKEYGEREIQKDQVDDINEKLLPDDSDSETTMDPVLVDGRMKNRLYLCKKCGYRARHKKFKEHLESECGHSTNNKKNYNCSYCDITFPSLAKFIFHFTNHGFKEMCCPVCYKQYRYTSKLGQHVHSHIKYNYVRIKLISHERRSKSDFQCKQCSEIVSVNSYFDHWQTHLSHVPEEKSKELSQDTKIDELPVSVPGCMSEEDVKDCLRHIMMKLPKNCNYCKRQFQRVYGCKRHIIEHLLTDAYAKKPVLGVLRCQICAAGSPTPEKYKQHMRDHASLPVFKCELCDRTFSDSSNFTKHKKVHNLKVFTCDLCRKKFQAKSSLIKHMAMHQAMHPITCEFCNRVFYFDSSYRRHVRYSHSKFASGFRCVMCNERFENLKTKWNHMWEVHKERKQEADCPICLKSFRKYSDVKVHAKSVHGVHVSIVSMKNASNIKINVEKCFTSPKIKVGKPETLVVYESE